MSIQETSEGPTESMRVRTIDPADFNEWRRMRTALWPDQTEHDMARWRSRSDATTLVADRAGHGLCGFIEIGERAFADGCETSPVAYVEGWWVDEDCRRGGIGAALVRAGERWARGRGLEEIASDVELENETSLLAHEHLGFVEVSRAALLRKRL